jgi:hypothetical protein
MKTRIPVMIQDPTTTNIMGIKPVETFFAQSEDSYLNGPVTDRIAVLDFDAETGELLPGVKFVQPGKNLPHFKYDDLPKMPEDTNDRKAFKNYAESARKYFKSARDFNQASVFGAVLRTIYQFEDKYVLGRRLNWAFDSPQLLVVPRAGNWANAFYQRESHSLQFFYFPSEKDPNHVIFTSLSRDIVAHETAHAVLDGIAPDLYNALTPQSLALHEAIADLTAVLVASKSNNLVMAVLEDTRGAIKNSTAFSSIAQEFGRGRDPKGKANYLRQLYNHKTLNSVPGDEPHALSEVLSGALYIVLEKIHEEHRDRFSKESPYKEMDDPMYSCSGKALAAAGFRLRNTAFRALDYLPPGDISFSDYGRAVIAVDQAGNLNKPVVRDWFKDEFIKRQIVTDEKALELKTNFAYEPLQNVNFDQLVTDDQAAQQFAERNRTFLNIPPGIPFKVRPRVKAEKSYYDVEREEINVNEFIFKVSWDRLENNPSGYSLPGKRAVTMGTTLAIDADNRLVRFLLTSDQSQQQCDYRDRMLSRLVEDGLLRLDHHALSPDRKLLPSVVPADTTSGILRIMGTAQLLHVAE